HTMARQLGKHALAQSINSTMITVPTPAPCLASTMTIYKTRAPTPFTHYRTTVQNEYGTITMPATTVTVTDFAPAVTVTTTETITVQEFFTITDGGPTSTIACSGDDCPF
ncbi:hypothetical protein MMC13_007387, partial [Lambiella insularis]|nr:hypothetical protein [Lambiella insularis]